MYNEPKKIVLNGAEKWATDYKELYEQLTWIHVEGKPIVISKHMATDLEIQDYNGHARYLISLEGKGYYKEVDQYYLENKKAYEELEDYIEWYLLIPTDQRDAKNFIKGL